MPIIPAPKYCDVDDVRRSAGQSTAVRSGSEQDSAIQEAILEASAWVDKVTGTWFDKRTCVILTQAARPEQTALFLPAPLITLTALSEAGTAITDSLSFDWWLEKDALATWSEERQDISITGDFGYEDIPAPVRRVTAQVAATLLGMVSRSYVMGDGSAQAVMDNSTPDWVKAFFKAYSRPSYDQQDFKITVSNEEGD